MQHYTSDRVAADGVIAFVSNSSFVDARTFDGFRKVLVRDFNEIRIIDLKGNARTSGERRRQEGGNIFDDKIRVGVAVWFCVKKKGSHGCRIFYEAVRDYAKTDEKREFLVAKRLSERAFVELRPDAKQNWLNLTSNDFETLMPIASKDVKGATKPSQEKAIFKLFSLGISTNRDEWVYGDDPAALTRQMRFFTTSYDAQRPTHDYDTAIKWSRNLKRRFEQGRRETFDAERVTRAAYRPFYSPHVYDSDLFIDEGG
jgi:predicted helicase